MSATATGESERDNFAYSLSIFAQALCGGELAHPEFPPALPVGEIVEEARVAARAATGTGDAQILAYKVLVSRLTAGARAREQARYTGARGKWRLQPSATALKTSPATEAARHLDALTGLGARERAALLLIVVGRLSYAEAALVMEIGRDELADTLARAREAFAARLASGARSGSAHLKLVG